LKKEIDVMMDMISRIFEEKEKHLVKKWDRGGGCNEREIISLLKSVLDGS
jgi:hypothetical protein